MKVMNRLHCTCICPSSNVPSRTWRQCWKRIVGRWLCRLIRGYNCTSIWIITYSISNRTIFYDLEGQSDNRDRCKEPKRKLDQGIDQQHMKMHGTILSYQRSEDLPYTLGIPTFMSSMGDVMALQCTQFEDAKLKIWGLGIW